MRADASSTSTKLPSELPVRFHPSRPQGCPVTGSLDAIETP